MLTSSHHRSRFFLFISVLYLAIAVIGFIPSFLRGIERDLSTLPVVLHIHAVAMMGWLTLMILQAWFVYQGKLRWHYIFALAGLFLISLVWLSGMGLTINTLFFEVPAEVKPIIYRIFGLSVKAMALVLIFYIAAMMVVRYSTAAHKRMIVFTSFVILDAAFFRMTWLPGFDGAQGPIWPLQVYHLIILVPLFWFDWRSLGRIHLATWTGLVLVLLLNVMSIWLWNSETWLSYAESIEQMIGEWWQPLY